MLLEQLESHMSGKWISTFTSPNIRMNLKSIMLNEKSKTQKITYYMILYEILEKKKTH